MIERVKTSKAAERAIPDVMHAAGARTSIRRTCNANQKSMMTMKEKRRR